MIKRSMPDACSSDALCLKRQVLTREHGPSSKTREFENKIANYVDKKYSKATNSGTSALHLALLALGIKQQDEVIMPSFVCVSLVNAVSYVHAKPIPVDMQDDFDEKGFNISYDKIKDSVTENTKAIIVPHMFGVPARIDKIKRFKIPIIEDFAQSLGASYKNKRTGAFGDISICSFYATKVISTGTGGMVFTSKKTHYEKIKDLTKHDERKVYSVSYNYDLNDIQSALGLSQFKRLNFLLKKRMQIFIKYNESLKNSGLILPRLPKGAIAYRYIIRAQNKKEKDLLKKQLSYRGIGSSEPVYTPIHRYLGLDDEDFPNTSKVFDTAFTLPLYPSLNVKEFDYIVQNMKSLCTTK